jgi:hypothetical protein
MLVAGEGLEENTHKLWSVAQSFTGGILDAYDTIPRNMKKVFGALGEVMIKKYGSLPFAPVSERAKVMKNVKLLISGWIFVLSSFCLSCSSISNGIRHHYR